jgi:hypothetical protein
MILQLSILSTLVIYIVQMLPQAAGSGSSFELLPRLEENAFKYHFFLVTLLRGPRSPLELGYCSLWQPWPFFEDFWLPFVP